jgi:phospho-N-acetylmuramoyl-pentapeptide-transferase
MTPIVTATIVSAAVSLITGLLLIPYLRKIKAGQSIRRDGPVWHLPKEGTPTMGGLIFIAGVFAAVVGAGIGEVQDGHYEGLFMLVFALMYSGIGFLDDFEKLRKKQNLGLTALQKFLLQLVAAVAFILLMRYFGFVSPNLFIPFIGVYLLLPEPIFLALSVFIIIAVVNAVNITDGVDGLVTGVSIPTVLALTALAVTWGYTTIGIYGASLSAGLILFLVFNFHPAKIFMGDTGSLFLGGAICALAFSMDMPMILVPLGVIYIAENLSDVIQVGYYKLSHGKRVFKMAPLHHHLEMCGWSELKLFFVFTSISAVFAIITYFALSSRYGMYL